ncbi:MAG: cation:proton antiporter, partial [Bacteroidota bacterium]|nr:cation:proton antiporter [Bacteroidota bacterium]
LGAKSEQGRNIIITASIKNKWDVFIEAMDNNLQHPLAILLAQIITIVIIARIFGIFFKKMGQPSVIGEIIAGIVLGPSLMGAYFPKFSTFIFPVHSLRNLQFLSQIGLIFFMFVVGMELDLKVLRNKAREAIIISHTSIIMTLALGIGLAYFIYPHFAPKGTRFLSFGLFIGIAMTITAFPVLARIVQERGIHKTKLGTIAITCAAADDITSWCILAAVIAIVKAGSVVSSFYTIILALVYVVLMVKVVRPFLKRVGDLNVSGENLSKPVVALFFITMIISSFVTETIGIQALFGAFMAGAIMPDNIKLRNIFIEKVEDVALVLLLPLFFVFTGLRTEIGLLNEAYLWKVTGLIILFAFAGKFIGSAFAAKFMGQNWKDSLTLGALMNTRGLMGIIALNIGYDLGVLTPEMFTILVIMALTTTFFTGPALSFINWIFKLKPDEIPHELNQNLKFKILVSFGNSERGKLLLRIANGLVKKMNGNASITALHLTPSNELHYYNVEKYEMECFAPIIEESQILNQKITTLFKASNDINSDIAEVANKGDYDLLLVGVGPSIFEGSLLGKILGFTTRIINPDRLLNQVTGKESLFENSPFDERTRLILSKTSVPAGVLVDKGMKNTNHIFLPIFSPEDAFLIKYAQRLIRNSGSQVTILDAAGQIKNHLEMKESIRSIEQTAPNHISLINERVIDNEFLKQQDLMIVSMVSWKKIVNSKSVWLSDIPSSLILSDGIKNQKNISNRH